MSKNQRLHKQALDLKVKAGHDYYWVHQTKWMGEPCLQLTTDLFGIQEAIYKSRPDYLIEVGVAWGGSTLYYATIMKNLNLKGIIGIDIFMPSDMKKRIKQKCPKNFLIKLINKSSTDLKTKSLVEEIVKNNKVMVILDSCHTHDHVSKELEIYSKFVKKNQYLICCDTIIEHQPMAKKRPRPWGKGNNPATALKEFISSNRNFQVDTEIENKLLMSNFLGYLKRIR